MKFPLEEIIMSDKNHQENEKNADLSYGISFELLGGVILGSILSLLFESPLDFAFGPGIGLLIGIIVSVVIQQNKEEN